MKTMQFPELHSILLRLNEEYGVTSITVSEEGFAKIGELIKPYLFKGTPIDTDSPNIRDIPRIGNVSIEVKPEFKKMSLSEWASVEAEHFQSISLGEFASLQDKQCKECRHSRWLLSSPRKCTVCTDYNCFEPK